MTARSSPRLAVVPLCLAAGGLLLAFSAAPAFAAHTLAGSFGSFGNPTATAVDNSPGSSHGEVYVADAGNDRVSKFKADGTPDGEIGSANVSGPGCPSASPFSQVNDVAVNDLNGDVYVNDVGHSVTAFDPAGDCLFQINASNSPLGGPSNHENTGLAVVPDAGPNGTIYVANFDNEKPSAHVIEEYDASSGSYISRFADEPNGNAHSLAADSEGDLYLLNLLPNPSSDTVNEWDPSTASRLSSFSSPWGAVGVAVDPSTDHVYVAEIETQDTRVPSLQIEEFEANGTPVETFGAGEMAGLAGIAAANGSTHDVYAAAPGPNVAYRFAGSPLTEHTLTVHKTGGGAPVGTVISSPPGIECGASCEAGFVAGREVTLTAKQHVGAIFKGWSGCESVSGPGNEKCELTVNADAEVSAEFESVPVHTLAVHKLGTGVGTVTSPGCGATCSAHVDCGATCSAEYNQGTEVTLTAKPVTHSRFIAWSGCESESGPGNDECHLTISADTTVEAEFEAIPQLTLTVLPTGAGSGSVSADPGPILACSTAGGVCAGSYDEGLPVVLTATTPDTHSALKSWSGCESESGPGNEECHLTMSADTTVQAEFVDVPIPLTGIADERTSTSETLRGSVDPNSTTISDCHFDYVSAADYNPAAPDPYGAGPSAGTVPCATVPTEPAPVAAVASNLSPKTTYHFRLQASSDGVTGYGADHTFTSLPIPPTVATAEANPVDRVTATLRGTFNPEGSEASFHFAYVSDASYEPAAEDPYAAGATTPVIYGGSGGEDVAAAEPIHGLSPETTYHFALVAVGPGGAVRSEPDRTFTTDQARPPSAATGPATAIGATTVTLNGTLDADGLPTTYRFELGPTTAYDTTVSGSAGEAKGAFEVALPLSGLASATTYHFRLIAHNADGTSIGADATFTTTAFPLGVLPLLPDLKPTPVVPPPTPCRHGFFKRHGRCLKKPHHRRSHKRAEARHAKSNRSARR